jgi:hypothetical protein
MKIKGANRGGKLMGLFRCEGHKLGFMWLPCFTLNQKGWKEKRKKDCTISSPIFISANCALGLYLLFSKEQPWLPLEFQQHAHPQMIASVC